MRPNITDQQQTVRNPQTISDMEVMQYLPEVVDGRLVFKDSVAFVNYVQWVFENQNNTEKIVNINKLLGFKSMAEIYFEGLELLEEANSYTCDFIDSYPRVFHAVEIDNSIIYDMQSPIFLGFILNSDGVYQRGTVINRISYNYFYSITDGDENKISQIIESNGSKELGNNVEISSTFRTNEKAVSQYNYKTVYFSDNQYRLVARLHSGTYDFYYIWSAETNSQKKVGLIWLGSSFGKDCVSIEFGAGAYYSYTYLGQTYGGNISEPIKYGNQSVVNQFYSKLAPANPQLSFCTTIHSATRNKGKSNEETKVYTHNNAFTANY
jgi:hypothetical protein